MKRAFIAINGYFHNESTRSQAEELRSELKVRGVACDVIPTNTIAAGVRAGNIYADLPPYDFCIYLDKDVSVALMLEKCGLKLFNGAEAICLCDDKMLTCIALAGEGIRMPETIASPLMYKESDDEAFLDGVEKRLGYPLVVKKCYGSMGTGVFKAEDRGALNALFSELRLFPHLYQKFIGRGGEDMRVITVGGKAVAAMRRVNEHDFRSNIERGGRGEPVVPDGEQTMMAERASAALGLDYAGVDILCEDGKNYLCEVNSNAFFRGIERFTGKNVAAAYVEYMLKKIYR